jgi:hypothetical protein
MPTQHDPPEKMGSSDFRFEGASRARFPILGFSRTPGADKVQGSGAVIDEELAGMRTGIVFTRPVIRPVGRVAPARIRRPRVNVPRGGWEGIRRLGAGIVQEVAGELDSRTVNAVQFGRSGPR